jgi:ATP-dependent Clp protease ATP-binding subunit ClpC
MFERFTEPARQVVVLAMEEARGLGHRAIGTEHVLLGLLGSETGGAARALASLGLTADRAREEVEKIAPRGDHTTHGQMPFTPRAKRVMELALREAMSMGSDEVSTEHMLLALVSERDGAAAQVLGAVAEPGIVRDAVLREMHEPPPDIPDAGPPLGDVPQLVAVRIGDDVHALLRRAAGHALADEAHVVTVEHVRRALDPEIP